MAVAQIKDIANFWGFLAQGWPYIGALSVVWLTHILTRSREKQAIKEKAGYDLNVAEQKRIQELEDKKRNRGSELSYISTQLIFILESFAIHCAVVAEDKGIPDKTIPEGAQEVIIPEYTLPEITFADVDGDWRSLYPKDMFRVMEIPVLVQDSHTRIRVMTEHLIKGADSQEILRVRAESFTPAGLRAASVARSLRRQCGFPASPLSYGEFSATRVLQKIRKRQVRETIVENHS